MDTFVTIWTLLSEYGHFCQNMATFVTTLTLVTIWTLLSQYRHFITIQTLLSQYGHFCHNTDTFVTIWTLLSQYGYFCHNMNTFSVQRTQFFTVYVCLKMLRNNLSTLTGEEET